MNLQSRVLSFADIISATQCSGIDGRSIDLEFGMQSCFSELQALLNNKAMLYIVGNGGSAAVASHAQIDFLNVAKLRASVLHEPSVMTCMANDYGYENAYARLLDTMLNPGDYVIAISSSGQSRNICHAVEVAKKKQAKIMTLSGFKADNPLRQLGHVNFWLDSSDYGFVEVGHQFILHNLSDRFGVMSKSY